MERVRRAGRGFVARATGVCLTAAVLALGAHGTALAAPGAVSVRAGVLTFEAGAATENTVAVERSTSARLEAGYTVTEGGLGSPLVAGNGCRFYTSATVFCPLEGINAISLALGDRDDSGVIQFDTPLPARIDGGLGNDRLTGGAGPDELIGSAGSDLVQGGLGNDVLMMRDGQKDPVVDCGSGSDRAVADRVDGYFPNRPLPGCEAVQRFLP